MIDPVQCVDSRTVMPAAPILVLLPAVPGSRDAVGGEGGPEGERKILGLGLVRRAVLAARSRRLSPGLCSVGERRRRGGRGARLPIGASFAPAAPLVIAPAAILAETGWLERLKDARIEPAAWAAIPDRIVMVAAAASAAALDALAEEGGARDLSAVENRLARRFGPPAAVPAGVDPIVVETPADARLAEQRLMRALVKDTDGFMARHVERPISLMISRLLAPTAITPNQMSLISIAVGICGGPFFLSERASLQTIGALLFLAHSILDGCDGELARLKFAESRWGGVLDFWGDNVVHVVIFACMGVGWSCGRCRGLAAVARRRGRSRHAGIGRPRLLAAHARQGRRRGAVHLGLGRARAPARARARRRVAPRFHLSCASAGARRAGRTGSCSWLGSARRSIFASCSSSRRASGLAAREARPAPDRKARARRRRAALDRSAASIARAHRQRLIDIAFAGAASPRPENRRPRRRTIPDDAILRTGRERPAALLRTRSEDDKVAGDADLALLPVDLDRVGAFVGGPGEKDLARAGGGLQVERRGVLERLVVEAARLEPRRDAHRNAGPAGDAIERMPAVIEQNAAARELRIDAPVGDARRRDGGRRLGPERRPTDRADGADRALVDERRDLRQIGARSQL